MKRDYRCCAYEAIQRDDEDGLLEWSYGKETDDSGKRVIYTASVRHLSYPSVRGTGRGPTPIDASRQAMAECMRRMEDVAYRINAWGPYSYAR
jgi:hypothetical protein